MNLVQYLGILNIILISQANITYSVENVSQEKNVPVDAISPSTSSSSEESLNIVIASLGGGEDEIFASRLIRILVANGYNVTALFYGEQREEELPKGIQIIQIPVEKNDPLRPEGSQISGLTPADASQGEWASSRLIFSRVSACKGLVQVEEKISQLKPSLIITPLFLHDVCILALAHKVNVPVVGVLTSRIGNWWAWAQLGVLPPLSVIPVPLNSMENGGMWTRASNLAAHYSYMSSLRQQWQVPALSTLPESWKTPSLIELYGSVSRLLLLWDPIIDPHALPVPSAIPVGGFAVYDEEQELSKDLLVPSLINRSGAILVSPGTLEAWIGHDALNDLYEALRAFSFLVLWNTPHQHLKPKLIEEENNQTTTKFIFKKNIPINGILKHSRHRFLISTCGETEVMAAVHFGSPILCLPVTTDQLLAARELTRSGSAIMIAAKDATVALLQSAIQSLSTERRFRSKSRELAESLHNQPLTPYDRLLFHVNNAAIKPWDPRYRVYGSRLPLLQHTNADVFMVLILLIVIPIVIIISVVIKLWPVLLKKDKVKSE